MPGAALNPDLVPAPRDFCPVVMRDATAGKVAGWGTVWVQWKMLGEHKQGVLMSIQSWFCKKKKKKNLKEI